MSKNPNTHIYLYAKHHYKRNDVIEDLRIIMAERCGRYNLKYSDVNNPKEIEDCKVSKSDMLLVLIGVTYPYLKRGGEHQFLEFVNDISPENSWKVGYTNKQSLTIYRGKEDNNIEEYDYYKAVVYKCLSILANTEISTIIEVDGEDIGEADYDLFPMLKVEKIYENTKV